MPIPYTYHSKVILRTPQNPFISSIGDGTALLQKLICDDEFLEALFLASPVLHTELLKYKDEKNKDVIDNKKLIFSITKYYLRMSSRCTPFGLFSGCAVVEWNKGNNNIIISEEKQDRHTRFDMHYLCALAQHLAALPFIKNRLQYFSNSACYTIGDEIRYVEYNYQNGKRKHIISSILASEYATGILQAAANGISINEMINMLVTDYIIESEATAFIDEMITAQVLTSELEPAVTGEEFLVQIIAVLNRINVDPISEITELIGMLKHLQGLMKHIDAHTVNEVEAYSEIMGCLHKFNVPFEENKLFQTDLNFILKDNKINIDYQAEILEVLNVLNSLNKLQANPNLAAFAKRFAERYEDAEIPLLEALDNETGIGYLSTGTGNITPLLAEVAIGGGGEVINQLQWGAKDSFMSRKLLDATTENSYSVEFHYSEFEAFKNDWSLLPPSMSVMFRILDENKLYLESSGSSSAANLLGRFAHSNAEIHQVIKDVVQHEEKKNPSIIFAEIAHLPESRVGNILLHPAFRKKEIPFLSMPSVVAADQITLQDLFISVQGETILLRSKSLNKIVIPRLSSAHNYSHGALPAYHFLADMQLQGKQGGIFFSWGALESQFKFLPRATYKNVVINPAQWNFQKEDVATLLDKQGEMLLKATLSFKAKWELPNLIVLADNDNELLINLEDELMISLWLDAVKKRPAFICKEFLSSNNNAAVKDGEGKGYSNQFIAILLRDTPAYDMLPLVVKHDLLQHVQQNFLIGSPWVYCKLYCGHKTADAVLQAAIHSLVQSLLSEKIIDSFFFIRYNDPNFHLRLRFHVTDKNMVGHVLNLITECIRPFLLQRAIWNVQNDTYKRELTRYGHQTIEQAEYLFYLDSIAVLQFLEITEGDSREDLRWQWAIRSIDEWLTVFEYSIEQKYLFLEQLKNSFHTEFKADKFLKEQLSNKYRKNKMAIEEIMAYNIDKENELASLIEILYARSRAMKPIVLELKEMEAKQKLIPSIKEMMPSFIHMLVNRIATSSPRQHELVMYDILYNYYKSAIAKEKHFLTPKLATKVKTLQLEQSK